MIQKGDSTMSRKSDSSRNSYFRFCQARADFFKKKKKEAMLAKNGEIVPDPKVITEGSEDSIEPDLEVADE